MSEHQDKFFRVETFEVTVRCDTPSAREKLHQLKLQIAGLDPLVVSVDKAKPEPDPVPPPLGVALGLVEQAKHEGIHEKVMLLQEARAWFELAGKADPPVGPALQLAIRQALRNLEREQGKAGA